MIPELDAECRPQCRLGLGGFLAAGPKVNRDSLARSRPQALTAPDSV